MAHFFDNLFFHQKHTCPWWLCFTFDNPIRRLVHNPEEILRPYVEEGFTVLDIGPGMGFFSIPLARLVGPKGRVIAADLQNEMLHALLKRAKKAGVDERITLHLSKPDSLGIKDKIDFALAFWMLHEVSNQANFLKEVRTALKAGGKLLISEPRIHVSQKMLEESIKVATANGFQVFYRPRIRFSRSILLSAS